MLRAPGRLPPLARKVATAGQLAFGAQERIGPQLGEPGGERGALAAGIGTFPLRRFPLLGDRRQVRPAPVDLPREPGALGVGGDYLGATSPQHLTRVAGVDPGERCHPVGAAPLPVELLAEGRELVERVARGADGVVVDLRQRLDELFGEAGRFDVLADLGLPQPVQQSQQFVVLQRLEPEQGATDVLLVRPGRVEEVPAPLLDSAAQPLTGEWAGVVLELQVDADASRKGEVPGRGLSGRLRRPHTDAAGERPGRGSELDPQVAGPVLAGVPVEHEPEQARVVAPGRGHAGLVAVEDEGQQHLERLRLARAVGAAQQQPPVGELEDLVVVLPDVEDARAGEPEAVAHLSASPSLAASVSVAVTA
ncbi:hypothetical protein GCM10009559_12300 [Pseudonocardia zijingensis]|uniref:Uncharacterized protein n=1 Tax=Pseudonocardia zijingensis TaxID=153376 RepID=A0ABN1PE44_9PSEU